MEYLKKIGLALVVAGALIGYKFYNKSSARSEVRTQLEQICAQDSECLGSVSQHFESCFEENYKLGGRHRSGGLNETAMVSCINGKAGKALFSVAGE